MNPCHSAPCPLAYAEQERGGVIRPREASRRSRHEQATGGVTREIMVRSCECVKMMDMMMAWPGSYGACAGLGRPSATHRR